VHPIDPVDIDRLYARYQNAYGQQPEEKDGNVSV
jgi:hypothetical protein